MSIDPEVDELLVRHHLRDLRVGHVPTTGDDDWWSALYPDDDPVPDDEDAAPDTAPDKARPVSGRLRKLSGRLPDWRKGPASDLPGHNPDGETDAADTDPDELANAEPEWEDAPGPDESTPGAVRRTKDRASQRLQIEFTGLERRMQWLLSTGAGAGIGWGFGLEQEFSGWITSCGADNTPATGVIFGVGLLLVCSFAAYRARGWWPPLAWACRIPASTALLAVLLYAPGATP